MYKQSILISILCLGLNITAFAEMDTVRIPSHKLDTRYLKPGMNQYLITMQNVKNTKSLFLWYWLRNIRITERNGIPVFTIAQHWYGSDSANYRSVYSINRKADFAPLHHSETVRGKTNAYNWSDHNIKGADSVATNSRKDFSLDFKSPNLNWNLDIETFEMLPLGEHKIFLINFYDAGLSPPAETIYKVIGSELINYGGRTVDCWKLFTEGSSKAGKYTETYWISKKDHEFLQEKDEYGEGLYRTKIKIPLNQDLLEKFKR
jgi:hypothetical protein